MDLSSTQREISRLLRAPDGVRAALAQAGDPDGRSLDGLVCGDARLGALPRLELCANAYFHRIREALEREYEALAEVLGAAAFHDLATAYLLVCPSRRPSLRWVGARLPDFLTASPAAEPFQRRWPWARDLARLEWAMSQAFDAPDAPSLTVAALASRPPEAWETLRLAFQPATRLLRLDWPVQRMREAPAGARAAAVPARSTATAVCVWRCDEVVRLRATDALEADLLDRAMRGDPFGALCERAADFLGEAHAAARVAELLADWVQSGLLAG